MKILPVLFIGAMVLLSACNTSRKEGYQQAYELWLSDGSITMKTLHKLDSGDISMVKTMMTTQVLITLNGLQDFAAQAHPTPEQKEEEIKLAKDCLDYMLRHRDDFDARLPITRIGMEGLRRILTEPDDVRRLSELSDYLAGVEKKMPETQKP
jgi:hypothetical protein